MIPKYMVVYHARPIEELLIKDHLSKLAEELLVPVTLTRELTGEQWGCVPHNWDGASPAIRLEANENAFYKCGYYS